MKAKLDTKTTFEMALIDDERGRIEDARPRFERCLQHNPWDSVAQIYVDRCG